LQQACSGAHSLHGAPDPVEPVEEVPPLDDPPVALPLVELAVALRLVVVVLPPVDEFEVVALPPVGEFEVVALPLVGKFVVVALPLVDKLT